METKYIRLKERWYNPDNKQAYEVFAIANLGFSRIYERDPVVVLQCLTEPQQGFYTIPASDFPGPMTKRI